MKKQPIKKSCKMCGKEHYDNMNCITKKDFGENKRRKYMCNKCHTHHFFDSKKGMDHLKNRLKYTPPIIKILSEEEINKKIDDISEFSTVGEIIKEMNRHTNYKYTLKRLVKIGRIDDNYRNKYLIQMEDNYLNAKKKL